jgi:NTP pyrophosphatase (non-canonical NTP hydrolase)
MTKEEIEDALRPTRETLADMWAKYISEPLPAASAQDAGEETMTLNELARQIHEANDKWWRDPRTGERIERNKGELLMLMVSEIAEAMEGERKNLMDDKLPHRPMAEVELADLLIRAFDYAGAYGYDLDGAVREKLAFNAVRADHTHEARLAAHGKKW